jgi:hypothetical protein
LRDEFRDICECVYECEGLESADGRLIWASGLGVTVTKGCIDPREVFINDIGIWQIKLYYGHLISRLDSHREPIYRKIPCFSLNMKKLPDLDLSSCLSCWWSLSVRPWSVSTKLCAFGSGVSDCKFTILLIFGIDPFLFIVYVMPIIADEKTNEWEKYRRM